MSVFEISGYSLSREYDKLANEMQVRSIICIVDYHGDCRDVAHTLWSPSPDGNGFWQLSARGISYISAFSREDFIKQCVCANVEVLMPITNIEHGEKLFEFTSKADWINQANRIWRLNKVTAQDTVCVDQLGRICGWGEHFNAAERDNAYPIEVFRLRADMNQNKV